MFKCDAAELVKPRVMNYYTNMCMKLNIKVYYCIFKTV